MGFRDGERAQAIQVGAVLLFAILIIAFATYQAVIIPADNRRVEFNHNQEVQRHLLELRNALVGTSAAANAEPVTVALGTRYPSRVLGMNPSPPGGSLRTVGTTDPLVNVTIENATVDGETGDFWDGRPRSYNTGAVRYRPVYHRYDEAPTTTYEQSVLFNRFPSDSVVVLANQTVVDGDRISLVAVNGSLSRAASAATSVDVRPISSGEKPVVVESPDGTAPVTLEFASQLPASRWETLLSDEENVVDVGPGSFSPGGDFVAVRVELDPAVEYRLQLAKAAVGQGATDEGAAYLTTVGGDDRSVTAGTDRELTLAVRDRYGNPVPGIEVHGDGPGANAGTLSPSAGTTDADGHVRFTYSTTGATSTGTHELQFTTEGAGAFSGGSFAGASPTNVTVAVTVNAGSGGGGGGGAYAVSWANPESEPGVSCPNWPDGRCTVDASQSGDVPVTLTTTPPVDGAAVDYALNDSTVATLSTGSGETDASGEDTTTVQPQSAGTVRVYGSSGASSDAIDLAVSDVADCYDLSTDFESGDLASEPYAYTALEGDAGGGVNDMTANSGTSSAWVAGGEGYVESATVDTSECQRMVVSYWLRKGDDAFSEPPEAGDDENLVVEYRRPNGNWREVETYDPGDYADGEAFTGSETINSGQARHDGFRLRFRLESGSGQQFGQPPYYDYWHVDDPEIDGQR